jgi:hypothetical protein
MRGDRPTTRGIGVESRQATLTKNPLHVSKAEFDAWLDTELRSDPYGRVAAEVILYGTPSLYKGQQYVVDMPSGARPPKIDQARGSTQNSTDRSGSRSASPVPPR